MTQEEKELLLKDLCARLPYGVKTTYSGIIMEIFAVSSFLDNMCCLRWDSHKGYYSQTDARIGEFKPYLRSMSNMTDEEQEHCGDLILHAEDWMSYYDYLDSRLLDYRGLIEKGLALEAPAGMYNWENEKEKDNPEQIPDTIEAAIAMLDTLVNDEDKEYILDNGSISVHHSLGRWIRNNWGLWEGGELKECLRAKGIEHPDDMSDYIIQRFIDHLKKKQTNDTGRNE